MNSYDLSVKVGELKLDSPVVIASGVWPYEPQFWTEESLEGVGAVCTKAISLNERCGNDGIRVWETPSGMLNSIGLQNSGVGSFLKEHLDTAAASPRPVIANVVMENEADTAETLSRLQNAGGIAAAELNISCPNVDCGGMAWGTDPAGAESAVKTARSVWNGQLWVKLTPQAQNIGEVAKAAEAAGADALVVANTWLGMGMNMETGRPAFKRGTGGLSGPAVFPLALRAVWQVCGAVEIPVVGCGGVHDAESCAAMMMAGASAVEAGTTFFTNLSSGVSICAGLPEYLKRYGLSSLSELVGYARRG